MPFHFETYTHHGKVWWRVRSKANGTILAKSVRGYASAREARLIARQLMPWIPDARTGRPRATHCKRGHLLPTTGPRQCQKCKRKQWAENKDKYNATRRAKKRIQSEER